MCIMNDVCHAWMYNPNSHDVHRIETTQEHIRKQLMWQYEKNRGLARMAPHLGGLDNDRDRGSDTDSESETNSHSNRLTSPYNSDSEPVNYNGQAGDDDDDEDSQARSVCG